MSLINSLEKNGHVLTKKTATEYATQCPKCGGVDRFCVFTDSNKYWCRQCNIKGDEIQYYRDFHGMTFKQAAEAAGQDYKLKDKKPSTAKKTIVETYDYQDTDGMLIFQVVRLDPKEFRQRRPGLKKDWIWDMRKTPRVLYLLPKIKDENAVFFTEGEKDSNKLWSIGYPATTSPGGCAAIDKLQNDHKILNALQGKTVWILPDNDPPGREYAEKVACYLYGKAKEVKVIKLPVALGGDVSDFLKDNPVSKLGEYVDKTPKWEPETQSITIERLLETEYEAKPPIISKGVLHDKEGLLIAGEGGVGKSLLRLEIAIHMAMGWDWLDFFEIPKAQKIFMMQYENSERTEKVRLRLMMEGLGITGMPPGCISWVKRTRENRPDLTQKKGAERLSELIGEAKPDVVIYDCLSNLHSANENDNIRMRNVMDIFTDINAAHKCAAIVIHHFGKPSADGTTANKYRVRGASAITDWADCVFTYTLKKHEHRTLRYLENSKMRNAKEIKPILLERNGNFLTTIVDEDTLCSPAKVAEILETLGGEVEMQKHLADAIVHETGCGQRSAVNFIYEAEKRKKIVPFKKGRTKGFRVNE